MRFAAKCPHLPYDPNLQLDFRPDYGFAEFDALLQQLGDAVPDIETRAEVLAALRLEGRDLDAEQLAGDLNLDSDVVEIIEQLAAFGDEGLLIHDFGAVCIATIKAGSDLGVCDQTTFVFAQRAEPGIEFFFEDENGGRGDLGVRERPLTIIEVVVMIDAVLVAQAPYDIVGGDWRNGYLIDETMVVAVSSDVYPRVREWYQRAVSDWQAQHVKE